MPVANPVSRVTVEVNDLADTAGVAFLSATGEVLAEGALSTPDPDTYPPGGRASSRVPAQPFYVRVTANWGPRPSFAACRACFSRSICSISAPEYLEGVPDSTVVHRLDSAQLWCLRQLSVDHGQQ